MSDQLTERERLEQEDMEEVLRNSHAKRFVWRILQQCGIYEDFPGAELAGFLGGKRSVGLGIIQMISEHDDMA